MSVFPRARSFTTTGVPPAFSKKQDDYHRTQFYLHSKGMRSYATTVDHLRSAVPRSEIDSQGDFSTVPGLSKVFDKKLSKKSRLFWLLVFTICAAFCLYQLISALTAYYTLRTALDVNVIRNQTITFPSVTICPSIPANLPCLEGELERLVDELCQRKPDADACTTKEKLKANSSKLFTGDFNYAELGTTHDQIQTKCFSMNQTQVAAKTPCEKFGSSECFNNLLADFKNITTYWGNCLIVSPKNALEYRGPFTYIRLELQTFGAMFLLHNKGVEIRHDSYFMAEPLRGGRFSNIRIGTKQYNFLNTKKDPCIDEVEFVNCRNTCVDEKLDIKLNCSVFYMIHSKLPRCQTTKEASKSFTATQEFYASMQTGDCSCTRKCGETLFSLTTDVVHELNGSITHFNLYYPDNLHEIVNESYSYSFAALLSDCGGNMGFYLGLCVVTVVEIIESLYRKIMRCINSRKT